MYVCINIPVIKKSTRKCCNKFVKARFYITGHLQNSFIQNDQKYFFLFHFVSHPLIILVTGLLLKNVSLELFFAHLNFKNSSASIF